MTLTNSLKALFYKSAVAQLIKDTGVHDDHINTWLC